MGGSVGVGEGGVSHGLLLEDEKDTVAFMALCCPHPTLWGYSYFWGAAGNTGAHALNENEPLSYYCESVILAMHLKISHIDTSIYTTPTFLF